MTVTLTLCDPVGALKSVETIPDNSSLVLTAVGPKQADQLQGSTKSTQTVPGVDANGDVAVTAKHGGAAGDGIRYSQATGPTGVGEENHVLRVTVTVRDILVEFATDGAGVSVTPTANDVVGLLTGDPDASALIDAAVGGSGTSAVTTQALTNLSGGIDDGDRRKYLGSPNSVSLINTVEVS